MGLLDFRNRINVTFLLRTFFLFFVVGDKNTTISCTVQCKVQTVPSPNLDSGIDGYRLAALGETCRITHHAIACTGNFNQKKTFIYDTYLISKN